MSDQGPSAPPAPVPPPLPPSPAPVPATPVSAASALVPPYPPARDLQKTLPGTGVLPIGGTQLVDGDQVVGVLRDFDLTIQRLGVAMHKRFDQVGKALETPAPTMADRAKSGAVNLGKYTGIAVVAAAVARALEHKYPGIAQPVDAVLKALNL